MGTGPLPCQGLAMTPEEFWQILHDVPESRPIFYRLYHDEQGQPVAYSMQDLPGNYIDVDAETFARASHMVRVIDGRLVPLEPTNWVNKLRPNQSQGTACHPQDICVIVDPSQPHVLWNLK